MRVRLAAALILALCLGFTALGAVDITFYGHSCFTVMPESGLVIMIDPYGSYVPYPGLPAAADVVLMTHGHIDHCPYCFGARDRVTGDPMVVWPFGDNDRVREGRWKLTDELSAVFVEASHVTASGGGQGLVCLFSFEVDGIRFAHLGDVGRTLTTAQVAALGDVDVLFVPVGGVFTIDAEEAVEVIQQLPSVRAVFPMHYMVSGITPWTDLAPVSTFLASIPDGWAVEVPDSDTVVIGTLPDTVTVYVPTYVGAP